MLYPYCDAVKLEMEKRHRFHVNEKYEVELLVNVEIEFSELHTGQLQITKSRFLIQDK